jgi:hypothetical protein
VSERDQIVRYLRNVARVHFGIAEKCKTEAERKLRMNRGAVLDLAAHAVENGEHLVNADATDTTQ